MFTKKHMIAVAAIVAQIENPGHKVNLWSQFDELFEKSNPKYDGYKFAVACGVINETKKTPKGK